MSEKKRVEQVTLLDGETPIGTIEVTCDEGTDPIQIAATAIKAITGAKVGDEVFGLDDIEDWWA